MSEITRVRPADALCFDNFANTLGLTSHGGCGRKRWIIDVSGVGLRFTVNEALQLSRRMSARPGYTEGDQVAIVVDDDLAFGTARILATFAEEIGIQLTIHRDETDALEHLNS